MTYSAIIRNVRSCDYAYKGTFEDMVLNNTDFPGNFAFDVINLDFTWVPFPNKESPLDGTWGAIQRLLEVQRNNGVSFDLFLTFNGKRTGTDPSAIDKLSQLLSSNLKAGRGVSEFESRIGHRNPTQLLEEDYVTFLSLGFPKLLAGEAIEVGYIVSGMNAYRYGRGNPSNPYDIIKFTFTLEIPESQGKKFAKKPSVVANYDTAIPLIFSSPIVDVDKAIQPGSLGIV